jgi:hypothetical protein
MGNTPIILKTDNEIASVARMLWECGNTGVHANEATHNKFIKSLSDATDQAREQIAAIVQSHLMGIPLNVADWMPENRIMMVSPTGQIVIIKLDHANEGIQANG